MKLLTLTLSLFGASMLTPVVMGTAVDAQPNATPTVPLNEPPGEDGPHPPRRHWCAETFTCQTDEDCRKNPDCLSKVSYASQIFCGTLLFPHSCWYEARWPERG
ncbi:hypothetical protein ACJ73_09692 [Blastomyces percursus]|uniref:Uncharacterized protein n=1 Tax=Blastomyces percursus TaxID=1658174 RepID=A0A1J9PSG6_9EURO|nr:hypothetical protein ACJ73_09692 [Blastomyces percursus]